MNNTRKKHSSVILSVVLVLLIAVGVGGFFFISERIAAAAPDPLLSAEDMIGQAVSLAEDRAALPQSEDGQRLFASALDSIRCTVSGGGRTRGLNAELIITAEYLDAEGTLSAIDAQMTAALEAAVENASRRSDIYDESGSYKEPVLREAFAAALDACLTENRRTASTELTLKLKYSGGSWQARDMESLAKALAAAALPDEADAYTAGLFTAAGSAEIIPLHFKIDEQALSAPAPQQSGFGSTDDPAVIEALLETEDAKRLIGDEKLVWSADIERIPDTPIRYYLDETLLTIVWQEEAAKGVGTFAEVFTADGSQLRRRIAGDEYQSLDFKTTSQFAQETNAVLALGGDFYHHDRACGIVVYQRQIYRFEPETCDTCFITADGDMLFAYRGQFETQEQAQKFVDENDVLFSLCFGPVLIDGGQDVTPDTYRWGEVNEEYARSAIGMFGKGHYLTMNINCQQPNYYYLATLRSAADEMLARGCKKAYTLDGGQTATTAFGGALINPVQFGWEKPISDIIYFGSALPEAE